MKSLPDRAFRYVDFGDQQRFETVNELAQRWLSDHKNDWHSGPLTPAMHTVLNLNEFPELSWNFLKIAIAAATTKYQLALLAAGAMEDLVHHHGEDFIDRIELQARQSPRFRYALTGMWGDDRLPEEIVDRLKAVIGNGHENGIDSDAPIPDH